MGPGSRFACPGRRGDNLALNLAPSLREAKRTKQSIAPRIRCDGLLRFARNDGVWHLRKNPRSRDMICPSFAISFHPLETEGAGNAGYMLHPRSRAQG